MNVLFIAIDDLKPTLGCYGDSRAITPNIDRLARRGVVFANNHCQFAWSAPSRASLLFGQRPDQTQIWNLTTPFRDKNPNTVSLPQNFRDQGYFVAGSGKIFHLESVDSGHDSLSWTKYVAYDNYSKYRPSSIAEEVVKGVGGFFNSENTDHLRKLRKEALARGMTNAEANKYAQSIFRPPYESADTPDEVYTDGTTPLVTISLIDQAAEMDRPFFIAAGFHRPHLPFICPGRYWDMYRESSFVPAPFQQKATGSPDVAYHDSRELRTYKTDGMYPYDPTVKPDGLVYLPDSVQRRLLHGYYACVSFADAQVGRILDHLEKKGLIDNTIIVLWGDHGWHLGDHSMWCKQSDFEQATRAPLIIVDPRAGKAIKTNMISEMVDIYPTLCDLTGIKEPHTMAGVSLRSLIYGADKPVKEYACSQMTRDKGVMGYTIRTDKYRYTIWIGGNPQTKKQFSAKDVIGEEFYDYLNDPMETRNMIDDQRLKAEVGQLRSCFDQYYKNKRII
ncbi:iduronate-2-sulfatase [Bacteroidia bacterium]|nr:iduronate-2-sulfatase [Bacteroidia bacterium]